MVPLPPRISSTTYAAHWTRARPGSTSLPGLFLPIWRLLTDPQPWKKPQCRELWAADDNSFLAEPESIFQPTARGTRDVAFEICVPKRIFDTP